MKVYIRSLIIAILIIGGYSNLFAEEILSITMHVEHAGTLKKLMDEQIAYSKQSQITNLILSGEINSDDISYIRGLAGGPSCYSKQYEWFYWSGVDGNLSDLDISNVNIVEGGSRYYYTIDEYGWRRDERLTEKHIISEDMFYHCKKLLSIKLPESVTAIRDNAFRDTQLTKISIPDNIVTIGEYAFNGCDSLMNISVTDGNMNYVALDGVLFNATKTELIRYPQAKNGSYVMADGISIIGDYAFRDCKKLTKIILSKGLTKIGYNAFYGCDALKELYVQNSVPIAASFSGFDIRLGSCVLYIPKGSYNRYYLAPGWGDFSNIKEFERETTSNELVAPQTLSISAVTNGISINSNIEVEIFIYNINGQLVNKRQILGYEEILLSKGVYIMVADNYSQKVIVK